MTTTNEQAVTVFGGTGFLAAVSFGVCVRMGFTYGLHQDIRIEVTDCSFLMIRNSNSLRPIALAHAYGVVNAVSLYVEHGQEMFHSVHVESAQRVAAQARRAGVERLVHVSGIGSNVRSRAR